MWGIIYQYSVLTVVTIAGSIAQNISSISKDILLTYVGFLFFDDQKATNLVLSGLLLSFTGVIYYLASRALASNSVSPAKEKIKSH